MTLLDSQSALTFCHVGVPLLPVDCVWLIIPWRSIAIVTDCLFAIYLAHFLSLNDGVHGVSSLKSGQSRVKLFSQLLDGGGVFIAKLCDLTIVVVAKLSNSRRALRAKVLNCTPLF